MSDIKIKTIVRSVRDLSRPEVLGNVANVAKMTICGAAAIRAYQSNPYLESEDQPVEMVGIADGQVIGSVRTMPMPLWADGKEYVSSANPDIRVEAEYRKTGYALDLIEFGSKASPDKVKVDYYVSQSARRVAKAHGAAVFDIRQFAVVRDSALFLKNRLPRKFAAIGCFGLNLVFAVHRLILGALVAIRTWNWRFMLADDEASVEEFVSLIEKDTHRFRPNATVKFHNWILKQDFGRIENADKHLWKVVCKGRALGFVITWRNLSGRGRVIDWQVPVAHECDLPWMLLAASHKCLRTCKAVVISVSCEDPDLVNGLKRLLPRIPMQAATVDADADSPLQQHNGWREQKNWRIRPTMGDSCLY